MIDTSSFANIESFNAQLLLALAELDREVSLAFRGYTTRLFKDLLEGTPQFSSDLVRNWNYSVGTPDTAYSESPLKYDYAKAHNDLEPLSRGNPDGISFAMQRMAPVAASVNWRDTVYFTNATPIAEAVEGHTVYIRPINLVNGAVAMIAHLVNKEETLGAAL